MKHWCCYFDFLGIQCHVTIHSITLNLQGIIITATTPTQSAVRLETGTVELQLSNRVENISRPIYTASDPTQPMKIFGKAQVRQGAVMHPIGRFFFLFSDIMIILRSTFVMVVVS